MDISLKTKIAATLASTFMLVNGLSSLLSGEPHATGAIVIYAAQAAISIALYTYMLFLLVRFIVRKVKARQTQTPKEDTAVQTGRQDRPRRHPAAMISRVIMVLLLIAIILQMTGVVDFIGMIDNLSG